MSRLHYIFMITLCIFFTPQLSAMTRSEAADYIRSAPQQLLKESGNSLIDQQIPQSSDILLTQLKDQATPFKAQLLPLDKRISMPYCVLLKEKLKPKDGRALFIALHGGGQNPKASGPHAWQVNDREFTTQILLAATQYASEGIYFVPRMADDRMGRWWHQHNQDAFDLLINHALLHWGVNPNKVYLLGISEGGYGTAILAPFIADRLAGANSMAAGVGLANPPANLRNLAFRTDTGELDTMFDRCGLAKSFHDELERLHRTDPTAYHHHLHLHPGKGHGIDYRQGIQWIDDFTRSAWPQKVVWVNQKLDGRRRERFYWISLKQDEVRADLRIDAQVDPTANTIVIHIATLAATNIDGNRSHGQDNVAESEKIPTRSQKFSLLLHDDLLNLDQPIHVIANGKQVFSGKVRRQKEVILEEFRKRPDLAACPSARLDLVTD